MIKQPNYYILCLLLVLGTGHLFSQEKCRTLSLPEAEGSLKSYIARDYIKLVNGFSYKAINNGNCFKAQIDPTLIFPPTENTYAKPDGTITIDRNQGGVVGSISGQSNVSTTGSATYSIPIVSPPGVNDLQPNVSLVYNSQGGNGIAGWGWNISGASAISRSRKSRYYDGSDNLISWDASSPISLDGQRLIMINASNDSIEYRTVNESFNRIVGYDLQSWGPTYFKIYTKTGMTLTYGLSTSLGSYAPLYDNAKTDAISGINFERAGWNLVEMCDLNGNYISFEYACFEGPFVGNVLKRILYGANKKKGGSPNLMLTFNYEQRPDEIQAFVSGKEMLQQLRLKSIQTSVNGVDQTAYNLTYSAQGISHLESLSYSVNGHNLYNPLTFEYGGNNTVKTDIDISHINKLDNTTNKATAGYMLIDMDGDGKNEIADVFDETSGLNTNVYNTLVADFHYIKDNWASNPNYRFPISKTFIGDVGNIFVGHKYQAFIDGLKAQFGDFNGDGNMESTYAFIEDGPPDAVWLQLYDRKNNTQLLNSIIGYSSNKPFILSGNFYGSTLSNLIVIFNDPESYNGGFRYKYKIVRANSNSVLYIIPSDYYLYTPKKLKSVSLCDFGSKRLKDDLLFKYEDNSFGILKNSDVEFSCFSGLEIVSLPYVVEDNDIFELVDQNQDGFQDLLYRSNDIVRVAINKGNYSFQDKTLNIICNKENLLTKWWTNEWDVNTIDAKKTQEDKVIVIDINNDGVLDLVVCDEVFKDSAYIYNKSHYVEKVFDYTSFTFYTNNCGSYTLLDTYTSPRRATFSCFGDALGHGKTDWIHYDDDGKLVITDFGYGLNKNTLVKVTNPVNGDLIINYNTLAENNELNGLYDEESQINSTAAYIAAGFHPFNNSFLLTVSSIESNQEKNSYKYGNALNNWAHNGFLGFKNQLVTNEKTGVSTLVYNQTLSGQFLVPERTETMYGYEINNIFNANLNQDVKVLVPKNKTSYEKSSYIVNQLSNQRYTLQLKEKNSVDLLHNINTTDSYTYDSFGNLTQVATAESTDFYLHILDYHYKPVNFWCDNKVDIITETTRNQSFATGTTDEYIRQTIKGYDKIGNLTSEIFDPEDENEVKTEYLDPNIFGQPLTVKVTANNSSRSSYATYTQSGRFLDSKTNSLGVKVKYDWNEEAGVLKSIYSKSDTTTYTYNDLNQLTETRSSNGIRVAERLLWAEPNNEINARYFRYSQKSGQPPINIYYDLNGREIQRESIGLNNKKIINRTTYNDKGLVYQTSDPFFEGDQVVWATTNYYDDFGRIKTTVVTKDGTDVTSTYSYGQKYVDVISPDGTSSTWYNSRGQKIKSVINGYEVLYDYYASGKPRTVYPSGIDNYENVKPIQLEFDLQGNRTKIIDPDAGIEESKYNGFGEQLWTKQTNNSSTNIVTKTNNYFPNGLLRIETRSSTSPSGAKTESLEYSYDESNQYRLKSIKLTDKNIQEFTYGAFNRITNMVEMIGDRTFSTSVTYDHLGREKSYSYPSGYVITNHYDENGYLTEITDDKERSIWKVLDSNVHGQLKSVSKGNRISTYSYDERGHLSGIYAAGIINATYSYNTKGNLEYRKDNLNNQREDFIYDDQNRLTNWNVTKNGVTTTNSVTYDDLIEEVSGGNILNKSDLGNLSMSYGQNGSPHALSTISGVPSSFPQSDLTLTYTAFKKVETISEGNKLYTLTYGVDDQRKKSVYKIDGVTSLTRYYLGNYDEEIDANGNIRKIHYIGGSDGLAAVLFRSGGKDTLLYAYTDMLGSLSALTDESGAVIESYAFDPWGKRRNPANWAEQDLRSSWLVNRGFTLHEHIDAFGIINMNGRIYDPLTAMFFSPDPQVSSPNDWLNYNRYSYCLNNPFKYTDPSGENPLAIIAITSALIGAWGDANIAFSAGGDFWSTFAQSVATRAAMMAVSYAIPTAIGSAFGHSSGSLVHELVRAGVHGAYGGLMNVVQGGKFWAGFAAGAVASLVGTGIDKLKISEMDASFFTGISGGIAGAAFGKGMEDAARGFGIGFSVGAFNHTGDGDGYIHLEMHMNEETPFELPLTQISAKPWTVTLKGFVNNLVYSLPYVGACRIGGEYWDSGEYGKAMMSFGIAAVELFTLGMAYEVTSSTRLSTATSRVITSGNTAQSGAHLATNGIKLAKQLASEAQMAEEGVTIVGSGKLRVAGRLAEQYGGDAANWVKKTSSSFSINGTTFETHWYENNLNFKRFEFKTKFH